MLVSRLGEGERQRVVEGTGRQEREEWMYCRAMTGWGRGRVKGGERRRDESSVPVVQAAVAVGQEGRRLLAKGVKLGKRDRGKGVE